MFIIIKLAIFILAKFFDSVTKASPTISGVNRVLGMVFGFVKGAVFALSLLALCSLVSQVPGFGTTVHEKVSDTTITSGIYKYVDEFVEKNLTKDKVQEIIDKIVSEVKPSNSETPEGSDPEKLNTINYQV